MIVFLLPVIAFPATVGVIKKLGKMAVGIEILHNKLSNAENKKNEAQDVNAERLNQNFKKIDDFMREGKIHEVVEDGKAKEFPYHQITHFIWDVNTIASFKESAEATGSLVRDTEEEFQEMVDRASGEYALFQTERYSLCKMVESWFRCESFPDEFEHYKNISRLRIEDPRWKLK